MDSRIIYSAINSIKHKIEWDMRSGNDWIYIGVGNEMNKELIFQKMINVFDDEKLLIALGRENSKRIVKEDFQIEIIERIEKIDFLISNESFSKFIEFNRIGIIRIGKII